MRCADAKEKKGRVHAREGMDRLEQAGDAFHRRVNAAFDALALEDAARIRVVETTGAHSDTARAIFAEIEDLIPELALGSAGMEEALSAFDAAHRRHHVPDDQTGRA